MKKSSNGVRFGAICLGATICVVGARCAQAQTALGDGQALDRNLSTAGPRNTPVRDLNALIRFNNAVVTGNAPGGRSFSGNVGYLAGDDFRAATGTDALYRFRRDSTSSAIVAAGIRGTDALQYQFALSTGQAPPPVLGNYADVFTSGLPRGGNPIHRPDVIQSVEQRVVTGSTAAGALRSTSDYNAQQALRPSVLAYRLDQEGRQSMLTASPLTGLNWTNMNQGQGTNQANPANPSNPNNPANSTNPADRNNNSAAPLSGLESVPSYVNNPMGLVQSMAPSRVDTRAPAPTIVMDELNRAMRDAAKTKPGDDQPTAARPGDAPDRLPGSTNLDAELERIRKRLSGVVDEDEKKEAKPATGDKPTEPGKQMTLRDLVDPTTGKLNAEVLQALQAARPTIARLSPDAPKPEDTYAAHMAKGESLLGAGKYYDAEDSFVRALALQAKDPLAAVGRVNAQLGAGAFVSAATNLKSFFAEHPEMIGTRYAASLMPSLTSGDVRAQQLRLNIKDPTSGIGKEAGMLLAYLGYQRNDAKMVKEGIEAMAAKTYPEQTADVTLLGLLDKIWNAPTPSPAPADQNK